MPAQRCRGDRGAAGLAGRDLAVHGGACLRDGDTDVRILATELVRNMPADDATRCCAGC